MKDIKTLITWMLPTRWQLPARYYYNKLKGRLEPEVNLVTSLINPTDTIVDVGANWGFYSYAVAQRGATVHAYEPISSCRAILSAYGHPNIKVHAVALSDHEGIAEMIIPEWKGKGSSALAHISFGSVESRLKEYSRESVPLATLDSQNLGDVKLIKIDVEGHELNVIRGARQTIGRSRPYLLVEIEQRHLGTVSIKDAHAEIMNLGYVGYFLDGEKLHPLGEFDLTRHQISKVQIVEAQGFAEGYINNFFFVPAGVQLNSAFPQNKN